MKKSFSLGIIVTCSLALILAMEARAQSVDAFYGINTLLATQPAGSQPLGQGISPSLGMDFFLTRNFGLGAETFWQGDRALLFGEPARPFFWDAYAVWTPLTWRQPHYKEQLEFTAGAGMQHLQTYSGGFCGIPGGCTILNHTNYYFTRLGVGYKFYFARHGFVRPEADAYLPENDYQYHARVIWRIGVSFGFTLFARPAWRPRIASPPSLRCQATPNPATIGARVHIQCGPDEPDYAYQWKALQGRLTPRSNQAWLDTRGLPPGGYSVSVSVARNQDWAEAAAITVPFRLKTRPLLPPAIAAIQASPVSVITGRIVKLTVRATSPQGRTLHYAWTVPGGILTQPRETATQWITAGAPVGLAAPQVTVTDSLGLRAVAHTSVRLLPPPPPPTTPQPVMEVLEQHFRSYMRDIYFAFNSAALTDNAQAVLRHDAVWLRRHPEVKFLLAGYYDPRGPRAYNIHLADQRARAAQRDLIAQGIAASRIQTRTAWRHPFCRADTSACFQKDRRVHFVMILKP